jgi:hypothetical protein
MVMPHAECSEAVGSAPLTAPEYALLLGKGYSELVLAALTELVARGAVRVAPVRVRSGLRSRETTLLVTEPDTTPHDTTPHDTTPHDTTPDDNGPAELGPVLAPVLQSLRRARRTVATDGTSGVTMKHWHEQFKKSPGLIAYRGQIVEAELLRKGLFEQKRTWYRTTPTSVSPQGEAVRSEAARRIAEAKALVLTPEARAAVSADAGTADAALAGLGAMGPLVLADPALLRALLEWRAATRRPFVDPILGVASTAPDAVGPSEADLGPGLAGSEPDGIDVPAFDVPGFDVPGVDVPGLGVPGFDFPAFPGSDVPGFSLDGLGGLTLDSFGSMESAFAGDGHAGSGGGGFLDGALGGFVGGGGGDGGGGD